MLLAAGFVGHITGDTICIGHNRQIAQNGLQRYESTILLLIICLDLAIELLQIGAHKRDQRLSHCFRACRLKILVTTQLKVQ